MARCGARPGWVLFILCLGLSSLPSFPAPESPLQPQRVCEVLHDLLANEGKVLAVVGKFSFREAGRSLSEEKCVLRIVFDSKSGPKAPTRLEIDAATVYKKLKLIKQHSSLGKPRFGSSDYDRWAVVYGRVETQKAPARIVCPGEAVVVFLADQ